MYGLRIHVLNALCRNGDSMRMTVRQCMVYIMAISCMILPSGCTGSGIIQSNKTSDTAGSIPKTVKPDIEIAMFGSKICQLTGEYDRSEKKPTQNRTYSRYHLQSTDLGVPFTFGSRTYLLFGDTHGAAGKDGDAIAYTTDTNPNDGLSLTFIHDSSGIYKPVTIPGISQGAFEVPMEGVEAGGKMYIYQTTDHSTQKTMGRSVVARSVDKGKTFKYLYDFSTRHFINVSVVKVSNSSWDLLPENTGKGLIMFGSGTYRKSDVYLAYQPVSGIEYPKSIRFFAGIKNGKPLWVKNEGEAIPVFKQKKPGVGELSVSYNTFIKRWILLYNIHDPLGIYMRTAKYPWGPWTRSRVIFDPWRDHGYCHFIHASWKSQHCDSVMDPGRENVWGGDYGPYQFEHFATGRNGKTTIYFTMSTWNPYGVVLMKAKLINPGKS